jgi:hypothetical protein
VGAGLPWARGLLQPVGMKDEAEQRLRETLENALAVMDYKAPETMDTTERDRTYDDAASRIFAAIQAAGFRIGGDAAAPRSLIYSLRHGVVACRFRAPRRRDLPALPGITPPSQLLSRGTSHGPAGA